MTSLPLTFRTTRFYAYLLLAWTLIQAVGTGIVLGNLNATIDGAWIDNEYVEESVFNTGFFFVGLIAGVLATVPFWAVLGISQHLAHGLAWVHLDIADLRERVATTQVAVGAAPVEEEAAKPAPTPVLDATALEALGHVLQSESTRKQANQTRRIYGRDAAAGYLTKKAHELGYLNITFTKEDLPDKF